MILLYMIARIFATFRRLRMHRRISSHPYVRGASERGKLDMLIRDETEKRYLSGV